MCSIAAFLQLARRKSERSLLQTKPAIAFHRVPHTCDGRVLPRSTGDSQLFEKTVVQDVEPTDNSVQNHPQNRMIDAPRDCDRQHTAEAPETDAC
jgi:hypothetical protein